MIAETDTIWKPNYKITSLFFLFCAAGIFFVGLREFLGGKIGFTRVLTLGFSFLIGIVFCILAYQTYKKIGGAQWWRKHASKKLQLILLAISLLGFLIGWVLAWTPLESFGGAYYYFLRAYPFIIWLTAAFFIAIFLLLSSLYGVHLKDWIEHIQDQKITFLVAGICAVIFTLLAWISFHRVVGVTPADEDFWYGAGVPVLTFQVIFALLIGVALTLGFKKWPLLLRSKSRLIDVILFLLIWLVSAYLWAKEPVKPDFLVTTPVAPNFEMYPDYDARNYDLMSQFALIGQGINNHGFFDRVLYPAFLTLLHAIGGQNYSLLMKIQAGIFAILPALIFLIGKNISTRSAGAGLAILTILRGINQINIGNIIETAHQKQMLTEFPTAVLLAVALLLLIKWQQNPRTHWHLALLAGLTIGLSSLLRPHTLVVIPVFIVLALWAYRHKPALWVVISSLFVTSAFLGILPWIQFSGQNVSILDLYRVRIEDVIRQRYPQILNPQGSNFQPISEYPAGSAHLARLDQSKLEEKPVWVFVGDNFLNNLVTSVQPLPNTPFNLDPRTVVKKTDDFWKPYWDGSLTIWAKLLIPLNLLILALGLGAAYKSTRLAGLLPLIIMVSYFGVNALARTSGGRYLVPVDWVILIYYFLGLMTIFGLVLGLFLKSIDYIPSPSGIIPSQKEWWKTLVIVLVASYAFGSLIPLSQYIFPTRFHEQSTTEQANLLFTLSGKKLGLSTEKLNSFLQTENAIIMTGRALYPRQFNKDQGLDISVYNFYHPLPYPRTFLTVIGQNGQNEIILPRTSPAEIPNSTDVMVVGCKSNGFIKAWAVFRLDNYSIYESQPAGAPLSCPLTEPVCDNNKSCHYQ
ncbi:MAG TPA: hypothetical protein VGK10_01345 [Prolixibacteraceae bacterium]|jgi:hypothetical protein